MAESHCYRSIYKGRTTRNSAPQRSPGQTPYSKANASMRRLRSSIDMEPSDIPDSKTDTARPYPPAEELNDGQKVLDSFIDLLESAREDMAEELSAAISNTEDSIKSRLDEMATAYAKRVDEFQANYTKVLSRIGAPVLGEGTAGGQAAELGSVEVFGFDRTAFSSKIEAETRSLERLWGEWEKVQQKIICLAVEVLGVKRAGITKDPRKKVMKKRLNRAAALFDKQQSEQGAMRGELQKQHQAITLLAENSVKQLKACQKKSMDQRKRQREEVCQLAKRMLAQV
ncbi:hypothetical protein TRV_03063 [Trichophyton verrucosum HKI 0517]|uniref:Uncharacterized protein n=1 Tax=Trichophyton verrucosum (strain HKI 0517) TaxID=663202 RepID=D4D7I1_TRIVH|nr:uncharacterized protein TRV_03063 [Trichophyton verrucosum HKI 0517]EFE42221.1 hypothetical protein TRV_03063 [Trichophyton verrucosum HKI 0517]